MADIEGGEVSRRAFQVAYYGTDPDDHTMDVEALAPALLAFGRLIRESNAQINGDRAKVKVVVTSDFEHKCFSVNFEVVQTVMQVIKDLLHDDSVQTATELLKTIGIIGTASGTVGGTLFGFLKWKNGRKIRTVKKIHDRDVSGDVTVNVEGDSNNVHVTRNVFMLAENKKVLETLEQTLGPIQSRNAERIEFKEADEPTASYDREEVRAIVSSCDLGPDAVAVIESKPSPHIVSAVLHVYSPVFDNSKKAPRWRFLYKRKPIYADISETTIASDTLKRGVSGVNDRYKVRLEVSPPDSEESEPHYKILDVLDFTPAPQQGLLPLQRAKRRKTRL